MSLFSARSGKKRILVIDDEEAVCSTLKITLEIQGFEVLTAESGRRAIEMIKRDCPDLILSDVNMMDGDGYSVLTFVRNDRSLAATPFILMTARPGTSGMLQGLQLAVDDYLPKPFTTPELVKAINNAFEARAKKPGHVDPNLLRL